jgi:hypothetical protein
MIRRALLLLAMAGIYTMVKQALSRAPISHDRADDARWANEGGANAPASV